MTIALVTFAAHRRTRPEPRTSGGGGAGAGDGLEAASGAAGHTLRPPRQIVEPTPAVSER